MTTGTVSLWDDENGWGVIDSQETTGGCWFHYSMVARPARVIEPGVTVSFSYEASPQDGYAFRAIEVHLDGMDGAACDPQVSLRSSFHSTLYVDFDRSPD